MTPERWERVQRLFQSVLTLTADSRAGYLDRECGDDTELRRELESLIAAGNSAKSFFQGALRDATASFQDEPEFAGNERFMVLDRLGSGGFGVVYQVYDRHRETLLALKTLRRTAAGPLLQLKREFRVLADISHPNLVTLYEMFLEDGRWFFTMELVDGVDFLRYASSLGDDFGRLRHAVRQLAEGVSALHQYGNLHCDLKPSNIMVERGGRVLILDFGLVTDFSGADRTGGAILCGTPGYMSPEQAAGLPLSPASDWYSVGVILYEALTGTRLFPEPLSATAPNPQIAADSVTGLRP
jgi:serine/threonine protein kinase